MRVFKRTMTRLHRVVMRLRLGHADPDRIIARLRSERLTYLSEARLLQLLATQHALQKNAVPGLFIEAGCALGGSTIALGRYLGADRRLHVHDVFGMIPPPGKNDPAEVHERYRVIESGASRGIGGDVYYGYVRDLKALVRANIARHLDAAAQARIELIEGRVENTLRAEEPVAFAHIDVDWYDAVRHCLLTLFPRLSVGGAIILDDYYDWGGCRKATDEFLAVAGDRVKLDSSAGNLKITRIRADVVDGASPAVRVMPDGR